MTHPLLDLPVHPAAAVFPMLDDDALRDLATDIEAHGLLHPIVLDPDGMLIDGRNRLAACNLAGVQPQFETFEGDPLSYIISANINRRDLRASQKAMMLADLFDFAPAQNAEKYGKVGGIALAGGVSPSQLARAITVRGFDDLASQVRAGASLKDAHVAAVERKRRQQETKEGAEKQIAYLEEQRRRAIEKLDAARAAIGPSVTIPPEPELDVVLSPQPNGEIGPDPAPNLSDNLDRESAFLGALEETKRTVAMVTAAGPIEDAWYFEGHVMSVRSWASQIVAMVYGMVDRYNTALVSDGHIRRVK